MAVRQRRDADEGGEERRGQEGDDAREGGRELAAAERERAGRLDRRGDDRAQPDQRPDHNRAPTIAAMLAASTGTPAGAKGTSASAISAPPSATARVRRSRSSASSSARKNAGNTA